MTSFKKTYTKYYLKANTITTVDSQYWKNFDFPVTVKEYSLIDHIDVSPVEPYHIAVTSGAKVDIYHQQTTLVWKSISRFKEKAFGAKFRNDGKLIVAGSEEAQVKLYNYKSNTMLRLFKGHQQAVHRVDFVHGKNQIVSFSDDKSIKIWDVVGESVITTMEGHKDYIRSGVASPTSEHLVLSGSYDHQVKLWDTRTGTSVMSFNHESPLSSMVMFASGALFASAGGTEVKIWDTIAGKLLSVVSQHHKAITCLALGSNNTRLLSGSLDQHIKVYDLSTYNTVHSMDYPAPILSLAVAPSDSTVVAGMLSQGANPMAGGTGLVSFQHKKIVSSEPTLSKRKLKDPKYQPLEKFDLTALDEVIINDLKRQTPKYDKHLCRFEFTKAFDDVIQHGRPPHVALSVLKELIRRDALKSALAGRTSKSLLPIFRFITKNIRNPSYVKIISIVADTILDIYEEEYIYDQVFLRALERFYKEVEAELSVAKGGMELLGILDLFSAVSASSDSTKSQAGKVSEKNNYVSDEAKNFQIIDIR